MKYSATERPSRYEEMIGRGDRLTLRVGDEATMPEMLRTCSQLPRAPDDTIRKMCCPAGTPRASTRRSRWSPRSRFRSTPATARVVDDALVVLAWIFARASRAPRRSCLVLRVHDVAHRDGDAERVAQWNPASLMRSSVAATLPLGVALARSLTIDEIVPLSRPRRRTGSPSAGPSLKSARPRVVSLSSVPPFSKPSGPRRRRGGRSRDGCGRPR